MELTGLPVLILASTVTATLIAIIVFATPEFNNTRTTVYARTGLVLMLCLSLVSTVGIGMNRDNLWYTSWGEIIKPAEVGTAQTQGASAETALSQEPVSDNTAGTSGSPASPAAEPVLPLVKENSPVLRHDITGSASGLSGRVDVVLPKGYNHNAPRGTYPVIVALHGFPGEVEGWTNQMQAEKQLNEAIATKKIRPSIMVIPQIEFPDGVDTECLETDKARVETWLTQDIPNFTKKHFPVATKRTSWTTVGYSGGAWCALMITTKFPDIYAGAGSFDGYTHPIFDGKDNSKYFGGRYDLTARIKKKAPPVALWLQTSQKSEYWPRTKEFLDAAKPPLSVTSIVLKNAGHRWSIWVAHEQKFYEWLGASVPGFSPAESSSP